MGTFSTGCAREGVGSGTWREEGIQLLEAGLHSLFHAGGEGAVAILFGVVGLGDAQGGDAARFGEFVGFDEGADDLARAQGHGFGMDHALVGDNLGEGALEGHDRVGVGAFPREVEGAAEADITLAGGQGPTGRWEHPAAHFVWMCHGFPHQVTGGVEGAGEEDGGVGGGGDLQAWGGVHGWLR
jgi:hypothetical protein